MRYTDKEIKQMYKFFNYDVDLEDVLAYTKDIDIPLKEKAYCFFHKIDPPKCICGNYLRLVSFFQGFRSACSRKCTNKKVKPEQKQKKERPAKKPKLSNFEKYGVEHYSQTDEFKEKFKRTSIKNFKTDHPFQSKAVKEKIKETLYSRYDVKNPSYIENVKEKRFITRRINYFNIFKINLENKNLTLLSDKKAILEDKKFFVKCKFCENVIEAKEFKIQKIFCPCRNYSDSEGEREVKRWLESLSIKHEKTRKILSGKELDIYIPEQKLAIEYNGLYWHCELNKDKNYHLKKTLACQEKGIQLIHIFENEWIDKQNIVKSIIKAKLGIFDERIFARKCKIKELNQSEYNEFLELNHLQGKSIAKTRIGLYYNDELVSVMGFGKSRFKRDETELIRFANKLNASIIGGFSKLLKYFIINYKLDKLISYCDLRYFDGSGYLKNGFEIAAKTKPNYYYWKSGTYNLEYRMKFQKHKLKDKIDIFDEMLSEHENMLNNKYYRIYDCGNLKMEYLV